ncbi:MAG: nicotinate (nicotinamide) nucleotide adenylyltransferase [candidate division WOR-3 bacterium]|nr:MAG: nicotinate (nicotinamide) nucleotide adenylyltransferase [candidate division WOR-3 bacterium]
MKVGVFGGLFDPPHTGHLIISQHVLEEFHLQKILFVPSGNPPHKMEYSPFENRYAMTQLAVEDNVSFAISDVERMFTDKTYTIEMIKELRKGTDDEFYLMIGSDQWLEIETWKDPEEIFRECRIVVMRRPHHEVKKEARFFDRVMVSNAPLIDISSTTIRSRIKKGLSVRYLLKQAVYDYIKTNNLYTV